MVALIQKQIEENLPHKPSFVYVSQACDLILNFSSDSRYCSCNGRLAPILWCPGRWWKLWWRPWLSKPLFYVALASTHYQLVRSAVGLVGQREIEKGRKMKNNFKINQMETWENHCQSYGKIDVHRRLENNQSMTFITDLKTWGG